MGKKITVEVKYYAVELVDYESTTETYTIEARFAQEEGQESEDFEHAVAQRAYQMLEGITTKGFIGHKAERNQFFVIKPSDIVSATATISDTIDTK